MECIHNMVIDHQPRHNRHMTNLCGQNFSEYYQWKSEARTNSIFAMDSKLLIFVILFISFLFSAGSCIAFVFFWWRKAFLFSYFFKFFSERGKAGSCNICWESGEGNLRCLSQLFWPKFWLFWGERNSSVTF